ncbi:hydantoinase/carbamoylase family amidase [Conexibacter sp. CPCC 206217]|uniref:hydantoinase/carbamoylase family amidase n=1 Tax=Conexibacter sp. CPCC 206217 TaxID=3064574 RepID=UPI0027196FE1|nr:hydantoinase/carbamoylase family amidase [Conexibacter sp. CPCC 206217]MDO8212628.1 hydantoinase/carbamoylase family amidase [Conexibacter sp. CPCC 206217]
MTVAAGSQRVLQRLERLFELGASPHANRPGLSATEEEACGLAAGWMAEAGLTVQRDGAGNVIGRLPGTRPQLPEVWTGSHLDTVPAGGRFDGALGVVAGIEAVAALRERSLRRTVAVAVLRDEEGWRFGRGLFGSRALTGALDPAELDDRDGDGITRREALHALGYAADGPDVGGRETIGAFVELHVEQGPVLARLGAPVGIVEGIVAMSGLEVSFDGRGGHAGTTPMAARADAFAAAAATALALRDAALRIDGAVATVGAVAVTPGAANVVPERAVLSVDVRAPDDPRLAHLEADLHAAAHRCAQEAGCRHAVVRRWQQPAAPMAAPVRAALAHAAQAAGLSAPELLSGAGHDAQSFAAVGIPTGMLFARSLADGVSHTPAEHTDEHAIAIATQVLSAALADLAAS